jgi:hypothetical protein
MIKKATLRITRAGKENGECGLRETYQLCQRNVMTRISPKTLLTIGLTCVLLTGCASDSGYFTGKDMLGIPGFFGGLFHGLITPIMLIPWLIAKALWAMFRFDIGFWAYEFQLYADIHTEGYPWGYFIGLIFWFLPKGSN